MAGQQYSKIACVSHYADEVIPFLTQLCAEKNRSFLIIAGAGFDPRATTISKIMHRLLGDRLSCFFIKEERANPDPELVKRAEANLEDLEKLIKDHKIAKVNIFAEDSAVIGGTAIVKEIEKIDISKYSDVFVDFSALSIGISFPIVKFFQEQTERGACKSNVHIVACSNAALDNHIHATSNDQISEVRGFPRRILVGEADPATLWLPELCVQKKGALKSVHTMIKPHDSCPVIPFPSSDIKKGDRLIESFIDEIENEWDVDPRNFIYADEEDPLDLYRAIIKIDDERKPIFENLKTLGNSVLVLSPSGSKLLSIGFLMAALQHNLPVVYVEALKYEVDWQAVDALTNIDGNLAHVWLSGEAYK